MGRRSSDLRVLFVYRSSVEDPRGGAASVMRELSEALRRLGVDLEVTFDPLPDPRGYDLVQVFNVWHPHHALRQLRHLRRYDVPIVWFPFYLHWCEWVWANAAVRLIFAPKAPEEERKQLITALAEGRVDVDDLSQWKPNEAYEGFHGDLREMVGLVDHLCVTSSREVQMLAQITRWNRKPFTVTPHGVNADLIRRASAETFVSHHGVRDFVLCVAAIDGRKNQLMLTEALADSGLTLVLCGPCAELDYLELCQERGRDRLVYTGRLSREEVASALLAARVHALPSFAEGAALSNLEAAVAGRALVMSNRSSEFEYFGSDPYYVDPVDVDGIAQAVRAAHDRFPEEEQRWRDLGRRVEERYTWRRSAERTLEAWGEVLGETIVVDAGPGNRETSRVRPVPDPLPRAPVFAGDGIGINLFGLVTSNTGGGTTARQVLRMLLDAGVKVHVVDLPSEGGRWRQDRTYSDLCHSPGEPAPHPVNLFIRNPNDLALQMLGRKPAFQLDGRVNVCLPFWELPRIPPRWIPRLQQMDLVLAASDFIKYALLASLGRVPVRSFPHPMVLEESGRRERAEWGIPENALAFVTGFEMSSDINRKNPHGVIEAFERAFSPADGVALVIKVNHPYSEEGCRRPFDALVARARRDPRIVILDQPLSYADTIGLWECCDVYVSLHRAEGLALGPLEAMTLGRPVIATGWSGNLDYMNERNSCLVRYKLVPVRHAIQESYSEKFVGGPARWAEPDLEHAAAWMQRLAADAELRGRTGRQAAADLEERQRAIGPEEMLAAVRNACEVRGLRMG